MYSELEYFNSSVGSDKAYAYSYISVYVSQLLDLVYT
jgi:hypothetical protein